MGGAAVEKSWYASPRTKETPRQALTQGRGEEVENRGALQRGTLYDTKEEGRDI